MFLEPHINTCTFLNKSQYIRGLQCAKSLWLHKFQPGLRDPEDESLQGAFDTGTEVGKLAQEVFPGGVEIAFEEGSLEEQIARTRQAVEEGQEVLYEATFRHDGILVKADILRRTEFGWELYEVKSSTKVKDVYLEDIAVQYYVLAGAGLPVVRAGLVHIDNSYVRQGPVDPRKLFCVMDLTEQVLSLQPEVKENLLRLRTSLSGEPPQIDIGPHCSDPYECDFQGHCWAHIHSPSVFDLRDIGRPDPFTLYRQGIVHLRDVPMEDLGWRQQLQVEGTLHHRDFIDGGAVRKFLADLWHPLCYLDFETTCMTPVPLFEGTRPYEAIPFQFSLHIQDEPGGEVKHTAFLADPEGDPQESFIKDLTEALPQGACILTYNQAFEIARLKGLAVRLPHWRPMIEMITANVRDLMAPFRRKEAYLWPMEGSYSIKQVLPAMAPEISYAELPIADGAAASQAWLRMRASDDPTEVAQLRRHLLDYCHLDTWGMVIILEKMREMAS